MSNAPENIQTENLIDLLDKLILPTEPLPISLIPETGGWYFLVLFLGLIILGLIRFLVKRYRANAYRRDAIAALPLAADDAGMLARIIRKAALATFPREDVAGLYGDDWAAFLERTCEGQPFKGDLAKQITRAPYDLTIPVSDELISAACHWISKHQRGPIS